MSCRCCIYFHFPDKIDAKLYAGFWQYLHSDDKVAVSVFSDGSKTIYITANGLNVHGVRVCYIVLRFILHKIFSENRRVTTRHRFLCAPSLY